jgi:hypothetical protein
VLNQACATPGPQTACGPRNSLVRPAVTTKAPSFVRPAMSNIERSKTMKEYLLLNQIINQFLFIDIIFYHILFFHPARQSIPHCQIGLPAKKVAQACVK